MKRILTLVICLFTILSIQAQLSRPKAEKILKRWYEYPNVEFKYIPTKFYGYKYDSTSRLKKAERAGLLRRTENYYSSKTNRWHSVYDLTSGSLRKYIAYVGNDESDEHISQFANVYTSVRDFKEVTGIRLNADKNEGTIEYTIIIKKVTPFGSAFGLKKGQVIDMKAKVVLYDDGWRIKTKTLTTPYDESKLEF